VAEPASAQGGEVGGEGMSIMSALASQVGGTLSFDSSPLGLTVRLDIPNIAIRALERA